MQRRGGEAGVQGGGHKLRSAGNKIFILMRRFLRLELCEFKYLILPKTFENALNTGLYLLGEKNNSSLEKK